MQVVKLRVRYAFEGAGDLLNEKELVLLSEIGLDQIPTATSFVDYIAGKYGKSQSGMWYTLKKLKKEGLLDFTEKGEEYKPLSLTSRGVAMLRRQRTANTERQYVKQYLPPVANTML